MEIAADLIKIFLPASIVLYGVYLTVQAFIAKQLDEKKIELASKNIEHVLPLRLQAYERLILFLERISPNQLLIRTQPKSTQVADFLQLMLIEIREEYNHNIAQQLYVSHENWMKLTQAKDGIVALIQQAASELPSDTAPIELSKKIMEKSLNNPENAVLDTIIALKNEAKALF